MSHRGEIVDDPTDEDGDEIERPIELVPERIDPLYPLFVSSPRFAEKLQK